MIIKYKTLIIKVLLTFYILSSFLNASHIHIDDTSHLKCKICIVTKNIDLYSDITSFSLNENIYFYHKISIFDKKYYSIFIYKGFNSQAPPFSS